MARIGELDRRIAFERESLGRDGTGGVVSNGWFPLARRWAERVDASDGETFTADERAGTRVTRFRVRSSEATRLVGTKDRIVYRDPIAGDQLFEILGSKETTDGRDRFLEFSAIARTDWVR